MSSPAPPAPTIAKQQKSQSRGISNGKARTILKKCLQAQVYTPVYQIHAHITSGRLPPDPRTFFLLAVCFRNLRQEPLRSHYAEAALRLDPGLQKLISGLEPLPPLPYSESPTEKQPRNDDEEEKISPQQEQPPPEEEFDDSQPDDDVDHTIPLTNLLTTPDPLTNLILHPNPSRTPIWTPSVDPSAKTLLITLKIPLDTLASLPGLPKPPPRNIQAIGAVRFKSSETPLEETSRPHRLARSRAARNAISELRALITRVEAAVQKRWHDGLDERLGVWRDAKYVQRCVDAFRNAKELVTNDRYAGLYGCRLLLYGSASTGMPLAHSDVDIALVLPGMPKHGAVERQPQEPKKKSVLFYLEDWAKKAKMHNVYVVDTARIPVLRYRDAVAQVDVDITISTDRPILLSRFIRRHLQKDVRVWELCMAVKYWAKRRNVSGTPDGFINPIGWTIMAIFFLQHIVSPPIAGLFRVKGVFTNTSTIVPVPWLSCTKRGRNNHTTSQLLARFFQFFGEEFKFDKSAVSINCQCLADADEVRTNTANDVVYIEQPMHFRANVVSHVKEDALRLTRRELRRAFSECSTKGDAFRVFEERELSQERVFYTD